MSDTHPDAENVSVVGVLALLLERQESLPAAQFAIIHLSWGVLVRFHKHGSSQDVGNTSVVAVLGLFHKHDESHELGNTSVVGVLVRFHKHD